MDENNDAWPFTILEAVDIMHQLGEGINYLHNQLIVHRDLKSLDILVKNMKPIETNIEIGYEHAKVANFGLSKTKDSRVKYFNQTFNLSTFRWMHLEIINLDISSQNSVLKIALEIENVLQYPFKGDIYSFTILLYKILTGDYCFHDVMAPNKLKEKVMKGERPYLPHYCPNKLKALIEKCWNPIPNERPSFAAIYSELKYFKCLLMTGKSLQ